MSFGKKTYFESYAIILVLITILTVYIFATRTTESHIDPYNCGYITLDIRTRIFDPDFLYFLRVSLPYYKEEDSNRISRSKIKLAVDTYNKENAHHHRKIIYADLDYEKIASLFFDPGNPEMISTRDLDVLNFWITSADPGPSNDEIQSPAIKISAAYKNENIIKILRRISEDPLGHILVDNAIKQGITFKIRPLQNYAAVYNPGSGTVTIDPTVLVSEFKLNFLAHELVHALNPTTSNSIYEETFAEIIAMRIQDRITNIPISCHTYIVFIDRLESPAYSNLPLNNDFEKYLISNGIHP